MFTGDPRFISQNPLLKEVLKYSVFMQFANSPPILEEEFGKEWVEKVESMTDKVLARWFFFPDIAYSVGILRRKDGYERLKKKLLKIDDEFFSIIAQMEFSAILMEKASAENVDLEGCFSTKTSKNPDIRVSIDGELHYFDVTKVLDYKGLISVTALQHTLSAFLEGFKEKRKIEIRIGMSEIPDNVLVGKILGEINKLLTEDEYDVTVKQEKFEISIIDESEGLRISLPSDVTSRKLKDKFFEKCEQFDKGERNIIVLDITSMVEDFEIYDPIMRQILDDAADDLVSCVILFKKDFVFEKEIKQRIGFWTAPNKYAKNSQETKTRLCSIFCKT